MAPVVDWVLVFVFVKQPGLDPAGDDLAALALRFGWAVLLHNRPRRPFLGGVVVRVALPVRHSFVDLAENECCDLGAGSSQVAGYCQAVATPTASPLCSSMLSSLHQSD